MPQDVKIKQDDPISVGLRGIQMFIFIMGGIGVLSLQADLITKAEEQLKNQQKIIEIQQQQLKLQQMQYSLDSIAAANKNQRAR
ncbi:MAG: hypothetical protein LBD50_03400 [Rickettsiales bacterium]|jgi:hypothetical protein|nr:hypothetical protein [Rickettsiales bacterium]